MFRGLQDTIKALNADVKTVANCEKAKKLRNKLLRIGLPMAIGGFLGVFVCFVLIATAGFDAFGSNGFTARFLVPFILFLPCGIVGGIGTVLAGLGGKIIIVGYTTNVIDEVVGNHCPVCGQTTGAESYYCSKCGAKVKKECARCKHVNHYQNDYCEKCGNKLDA